MTFFGRLRGLALAPLLGLAFAACIGGPQPEPPTINPDGGVAYYDGAGARDGGGGRPDGGVPVYDSGPAADGAVVVDGGEPMDGAILDAAILDGEVLDAEIPDADVALDADVMDAETPIEDAGELDP